MEKVISVVIPAYNEEENIPLIFNELSKIFEKSAYNCEVIFVNDGSVDKSQSLIDNICKQNVNAKSLEFSKNFGKEAATSAGLHFTKGDAAIVVDADLQHPVELIPQFIERWENGAEIVIGIRKNSKSEGALKKVGSYAFYKIMNAIGDTQIVSNATDFRLIDRKVIDIFNQFTERQRMTRGILDWVGFKKEYLYFEAKDRKTGKPKYGFLKLFKLAISSFVAYSLLPLKLAGYLGLCITFFSGVLGAFIITEKYIFGDPWQLHIKGIAMLAVLLVFLVGITMMCLGLIALYIANIHVEVINRPLYIIKSRNNIDNIK